MINKMKRVNSFLIAAFVAASSMFIVSCGSDDVEDPDVTVKVTSSDKPTITENVGANAEVVRDEGVDIKFDIDFTQGTNKMSSISITSTVDGIGTFAVWDTTKMQGGILNWKGGKEFDKTIKTTVGKVKETFEFKMVDAKGNPSSFTLSVHPTLPAVVPTPGSYITSVVTLYGQGSNAGGSFYSTTLGRVLKQKEAEDANVKTKAVDFIYYYTEAKGAVLSSPNSEGAKAIFSKWGTSSDRATKFTLTGITSVPLFNGNVVNDAWWTAVAENAGTWITGAEMTQLINGNVYALQTKEGKIYAINVTGITTGTAGTITLKIVEKVEE